MKKTLSLLAVLMAAGVAATPVQAATHYVSAFGGVSWMQNANTSQTYLYATPSTNDSADVDFGSGLTLTGAIGCDYGSYRLEAEVGHQTNNVKSVVITDYPTTSFPLRGDVSVLSLMGNGYYDFDLGSKVELYATAGIGVAQVSSHNIELASPYNNNTNPGWNDQVTTLAWQVGAGLAAPMTDNVKLDLRYRYFATTDFSTDLSWAYEGLGSQSTNISSHSVMLGLRVGF